MKREFLRRIPVRPMLEENIFIWQRWSVTMAGDLGYATVGSNQLEAAKRFYDELLRTADIRPLFDHPSGGRVYGRAGRIIFGVLGPYNQEPATVGNGSMISFRFETRQEAAAFHAQALRLGATNEGSPGARGGDFFMSYFRDLDGNKLCAFCDVPVAGVSAD